jgi:hypothetical protein
MAAVVAEPTRTKRWDVCPAFPEQIEMRIKWRELDPVRKLISQVRRLHHLGI